MDSENQSITPLVWELLFGERFEHTPDPNKPENSAYITAMRRQRAEGIRHFAVGAGKPLFDEWKKKVRENTLALLSVPKAALCNCAACLILREIRPRLELIVEAEMLINKE